MQSQASHGKMLTVRNGWLVCPICRQNRKLLQIAPETRAKNLILFCRMCKNECEVDIDEGQCFESRSQ